MDLALTTGYVAGLPDTLNLRDLGGIEARDGRTVRRGLLYRGSALVGLDDAEREVIDGLGLHFILDLRARGEAEEGPEYVPAGAERLRKGGMYLDGQEVDFSPSGISRISTQIQASPSTFMRKLYVSMMFGNPAVHELVRRLVDGCAPLYFHCTAGKDRTGVCAAVLLLLLDVSDDAIVRDFLLTNQYRASIINMPPEQLPAWLPEADRANWGKMNGVSEEDLHASLEAVVERCGSREAYAEAEFGLDAAALVRLRDQYLA